MPITQAVSGDGGSGVNGVELPGRRGAYFISPQELPQMKQIGDLRRARCELLIFHEFSRTRFCWMFFVNFLS